MSVDGRVIYAASNDGDIYQSCDRGRTWLWSGAPTAEWTDLACTADGREMMAAGKEGMFVSPVADAAESGPIPAGVSRDGTRATIEWLGEPKHAYWVFRKGDIEAPLWERQGALVADSSGRFRLSVPALGQRSFWKAAVALGTPQN